MWELRRVSLSRMFAFLVERGSLSIKLLVLFDCFVELLLRLAGHGVGYFLASLGEELWENILGIVGRVRVSLESTCRAVGPPRLPNEEQKDAVEAHVDDEADLLNGILSCLEVIDEFRHSGSHQEQEVDEGQTLSEGKGARVRPEAEDQVGETRLEADAPQAKDEEDRVIEASAPQHLSKPKALISVGDLLSWREQVAECLLAISCAAALVRLQILLSWWHS